MTYTITTGVWALCFWEAGLWGSLDLLIAVANVIMYIPCIPLFTMHPLPLLLATSILVAAILATTGGIGAFRWWLPTQLQRFGAMVECMVLHDSLQLCGPPPSRAPLEPDFPLLPDFVPLPIAHKEARCSG